MKPRGEERSSLDDAREIDRLCDAFEQAWHKGQTPNIDTLMAQLPTPVSDESARVLLLELVMIDMARRWEAASRAETSVARDTPADKKPNEQTSDLRVFPARPLLPDYASLHPLLGAPATWPAEPIIQEFRVRLNAREPVAMADYLERFPHLATELQTELSRIESEFAAKESINAASDATVSSDVVRSREIAHFELLEKIGEGGFGAVWRAHDKKLDRIVALKIPRRDTLATGEIEKFLKEARAAASLDHENLVGVYEVGDERDGIFISQKFVKGENLESWLQNNDPTPREAAELCRKLAMGLDYAHKSGVVHRDLKPSNILISEDGKPLVTDFGLAKLKTTDLTVTLENTLLGTPAYMSPEQARGKAHKADRRSDIFSIGVILYRLLTGQLPFVGKLQMLLLQIQFDEPRLPRRLDHRIPIDLETICLKCLQKEPNHRYQSAGDLANDLDAFLKGETIQARPVSRFTKLQRWCRRKPAIASLTAALLLAVIAGFLGITSQWQRAEEEARRARDAEDKSEQDANAARAAEQRADIERRKAETTVVDRSTSAGLAEAEHGNNRDAVLWFAHAAAGATDDPPRYWANLVRFLSWQRTISIPVAAWKVDHEVTNIRFDTTGRYLTLQCDNVCTIWDIESQSPLQIAGLDAAARFAAWSPSGEYLAIATRDKIRLVKIQTDGSYGKVQLIDFEKTGPIGPIKMMEWSPDSRHLVALGDFIGVYDTKSTKTGIAFPQPSNPESTSFRPDILKRTEFLRRGPKPFSFAIDPTSQKMAAAFDDKRICVFSLTTDENASCPQLIPAVPWYKKATDSRIPEIIFVDGGSAFCAKTSMNELSVWETATGTRRRNLAFTGEQIISSFAFKSQPAVGLYGYRNLDFYFLDFESPRQTINAHANWIHDVAVSQDKQRLLTTGWDRTAKLWDLETMELLDIIPHQNEVRWCAMSADGKRFATIQSDALVRVWTVAFAGDQHFVDVSRNDVGIVFSRDGRRFAPLKWWKYRTDTPVSIYDASTGTTLTTLVTSGLTNGGDFSPDNAQVVVATASPESNNKYTFRPGGQLELFDLNAATPKSKAIPTNFEPVDARYSPSGRRVITLCADGTILVIDTSTRQKVASLVHGETVSGQYGWKPRQYVYFSSDGRRFATIGKKIARVWQTDSLKEVVAVSAGNAIRDIVFSNSGRLVAFAIHANDERNYAEIHDLSNLREAPARLKHPDRIFSLQFSSDEKRLLSSCRDHTAKLWNLSTQQLACPELQHDDEVFDARFLNDETWVITACRDGSVQVWETITGRPVSCPRYLPAFTRTLQK